MRRTFSIHLSITLLATAAVLPVLIYSGVLVERARVVERELIERSIIDTVHSASADLGRRLDALKSLARTIGDARTLRVDDMPAFYLRWTPVVKREGLTLVLYDLNGQQLVNSSVPFGTALPSEPAMITRVLETGDARLFRSGPTTDRWKKRVEPFRSRPPRRQIDPCAYTSGHAGHRGGHG